MDVEVVAETLAQHEVLDVGVRTAAGFMTWRWQCSCGWSSGAFDAFDANGQERERAASRRHVAERVMEAIRTGAPEAPVADPATFQQDSGTPVPAAEEVC